MNRTSIAARWIALGAGIAGLAVAAGAFGAHALAAQVPPERLATFETGARYAMYHAFALVLVGLAGLYLPAAEHLMRWAGRLFTAGIVFFSGSLWLLVLTDTPLLGAVTPLGGVCFIGGWGLFALAAWRQRNAPASTEPTGAKTFSERGA